MRGYKGKIAPPRYSRRMYSGGRGGCMTYIVGGIGMIAAGIVMLI